MLKAQDKIEKISLSTDSVASGGNTSHGFIRIKLPRNMK